MIAALTMYERPEVADANDRFWTAIRSILGDGPKTLTRDMDLWEIWQSPDLLLAQTCGYPYRARLHGHVTLIGTPDYGVPGCAAGYYNSLFITRTSDPRQTLRDFGSATFAYNEPMSQSGWAAPMTHMAERNLGFASHLQSGAHLESARMVARKDADIAAIDAVTWAMIQQYDECAKDLHVIARSTPTPGLPYIAAKGADRGKLFCAINAAISGLPRATREALHLKGLVDIPAAEYLAIPTPDAANAPTS